MILGEETTWQDVEIFVNGRKVAFARGISYTTKRDSPNIHGTGASPRAFSRKAKNYEGELTILKTELDNLQALVPPGRDLTDVTLQVTVAYPKAGGINVDSLIDCRVTEIPKSLAVDDDFMEVALPLAIGKILYNI